MSIYDGKIEPLPTQKKTLTEQWREGTLPQGWYYCHCYDEVKKLYCGDGESLELDDPETSAYYFFHRENGKGQVEVLAPVPDYSSLYNPNDGRIPVGLFTVLKLIKRDIEQYQKTRNLTDLECGIKSQVVSLLKRRGWDLGKDGFVSKTDESFGNTEQLEKRLEIATKALKKIIRDYEINGIGYLCVTRAKEALKEMEGVK